MKSYIQRESVREWLGFCRVRRKAPWPQVRLPPAVKWAPTQATKPWWRVKRFRVQLPPLRVNETQGKLEGRWKCKNVPFGVFFFQIKIELWANGSVSWTQGNGEHDAKKIFCALMALKLPFVLRLVSCYMDLSEFKCTKYFWSTGESRSWGGFGLQVEKKERWKTPVWSSLQFLLNRKFPTLNTKNCQKKNRRINCWSLYNDKNAMAHNRRESPLCPKTSWH